MKYKDVENYILREIKEGNYKVGDKLPADFQLSEKLNISTQTINKALIKLSEKGYLVRKKGSGTFVRSNVINDETSPMKHSSLTEDIRRKGMIPGSKLLEYKVICASEVPDVAKEMSISQDELLHYFVRVRYGDNIPIIVTYSYMRIKQIPYIDVEVLNSGSLWEFLSDKGFEGTRISYHNIDIKNADEFLAKNLNVPIGYKLLHAHHVSVMEDGTTYNYTDNYYVSERFDYSYAIINTFQTHSS